MKKSVLVALTLAVLAGGAVAQEVRGKTPGQTLYLPVYSHLLYGNFGRNGAVSQVQLSALVSIRNTDAKRAIRVSSANYYSTQGKLLKNFIPTPVAIPPFGTHELFVEQNDTSGGSGANFVIEWSAEAPVSPPLVEGLHANMDSGKAVIVTTQAVPIKLE